MLRQPGLFEQLQRDYRVMIAGPTNLAALLTSFQMGFRSLALQKRSSEVWQLLGAIKGEFDRYGMWSARSLAQLNAASNSVESLGRRTRSMSRKLKDVEVLSHQQAAQRGFWALRPMMLLTRAFMRWPLWGNFDAPCADLRGARPGYGKEKCGRLRARSGPRVRVLATGTCWTPPSRPTQAAPSPEA